MKKSVFFIVAIISSLFFYSCREKCENGIETAFGYLPQMESYFGMYKPGNWWVYKNQDSTKTDSIYFIDYSERIERMKEPCITWPVREFKLHSQFLWNGGSIVNGLYIGDKTNSFFLPTIHVKLDSDDGSYPKSSVYGFPAVFYDSIFVNLLKYNNVIGYQNLLEGGIDTIKTFLAPNVGIIKYSNSLDTFSLKTYHIQ